MEHSFYGRSDCAGVRPLPGVPLRDPEDLFGILLTLWCADTCAPRMRAEWSRENPTLGQCSITAFLCRDLFGGEVYGVPLEDGNHHCYNVVNGVTFDLTSEQFGERKLDYTCNPKQERETHFAKEEKYRRYLLLKERLEKVLAARTAE